MAKNNNTALIIIGFILLAILIVMLFNNSDSKSEVYVMKPNDVTRNVYLPNFRLPNFRLPRFRPINNIHYHLCMACLQPTLQ